MKLATEAPVNGGRNYEPLVVVKFGYMLENLSIRRYSLGPCPRRVRETHLFAESNKQ